MAFHTVLPISNAKQVARFRSKIAKLPPSSDRAASFQELKSEARRCQTPKQFRELLEHLRAFIPFQKLFGLWGYPSRTTIRFIFNQGFPLDWIRWRLTTGALWTSPLFQEWLRTKRTVLWCDAVKHLKVQFDPELVRQMKQAGAQYALCGGFASQALLCIVCCRHAVCSKWKSPPQAVCFDRTVPGPGKPACVSSRTSHEA